MGEDFDVGALFCELLHSESAVDVDLNGEIEIEVEVYGGCAI